MSALQEPAPADPARHRAGILAMVACTVLWSMGGVLTRTASVASGWEAAFLRSTLLCVAIAALMLIEHRARALAQIAAIGRIGLLSALAWAAMFTCFMLALSYTTVANTLVIMGTLPLFAAAAGWIFLREPVPPRTWLAMAAAAVGIGIMFHDALRAGSLAGSLVALAIPIAAALNYVAVKVGRVDLVPALLLGGALSALAAWPQAAPLAAGGREIAIFGALAVFQLALPCIVFVRFVVPRLSAAEIGLLSLLEVVLGPLWVWLAQGEEPGAAVLAGGALVLAALAANEGIALARERRAKNARA